MTGLIAFLRSERTEPFRYAVHGLLLGALLALGGTLLLLGVDRHDPLLYATGLVAAALAVSRTAAAAIPVTR